MATWKNAAQMAAENLFEQLPRILGSLRCSVTVSSDFVRVWTPKVPGGLCKSGLGSLGLSAETRDRRAAA